MIKHIRCLFLPSPSISTGSGKLHTPTLFAYPAYNKGQVVRLNNVYFKASSAELLPDSYAELDGLVEQMQLRSTLRIRLEGHTDIIGDARLNQQLSEDRVAAIKLYITSKEIDNRRIDLKGYWTNDL